MKQQPLYLELYERLKAQIIEGQYQSGDKFPSKRALQQHLSTSNTTIEHAYQYLLDEGYIYSKPRSGYYVSDIESLPILNQSTPTQAFRDTSLTKDTAEEDEDYRYSFNLSEIDTQYFPLKQFRKYARDVFETEQSQLLLQGNPKGENTLRQQIARYVFNSRGVSCHTSQVIIGSSTKQLINLLTDLLKHSKFIIEDPSYPPIKQVLDQKLIPYKQLEVEEDGICTDHLHETHHDVIYVTPSHQFPTGYVMNLKKRTQLINWARQSEERYIIEDDYDSEFRYFGKPISALQSLDQSGKVIYMSTFSKSLFPSCRVAYMILPERLLAIYESLQYKEVNTVPVHLQYIIAAFMKSGGFDRHVNKMRKLYRSKLTYILEALKPYENQLQIHGALTGMHFTLTVTNGRSLSECLQRAEALSLKIIPFQSFDTDETETKFILGFGGIPFSELKTHTEALIQALVVK